MRLGDLIQRSDMPHPPWQLDVHFAHALPKPSPSGNVTDMSDDNDPEDSSPNDVSYKPPS